jgi:SulP family sulfate permease
LGAADRFKEAIRTIEKPVPVIILRIRNVPAIDASGLHMLEEFLHQCKSELTTPVLSGVHKQPLDAMRKSGLLKEIGEENIKNNIDEALDRAREILS